MRFVIDAGHGLYTSGKRCMKKLDPNETREWTLNQRIASKVVELLKTAGQDVLRVDDKTGKTDVSLSSRTSKANTWNADAYISIHHDSGVGGTSGGGATVFAHPSASAKAKTLRSNVYDEYIKAGGIKGNRSTPLNTANYQVLRETKMPAVLIECGFMDSSTDVPLILSAGFPEKAARGIAEGIAKTFGFELKAAVPENKPVQPSTHWAQGCLDSLVKKGIISSPEQWDDFNASLNTLTVGQLLALIDKATN